VPGLEEIAKFAETLTKEQDKSNIEPEIEATDVDQYPTQDVDDVPSGTLETTLQLDTIEQASVFSRPVQQAGQYLIHSPQRPRGLHHHHVLV
jgi:hypothetical protein